MTIKLYEAFGGLAHEKTRVYSEHVPASDIYNIVTVDVPDDYKPAKNVFGDTVLTIGKYAYKLSEVISCRNDSPCIRWYDGNTYHHKMLSVSSRVEH